MSKHKRPDDQYPVLLIHESKHGDRYILATNNDEEELAWLAMFTILNVQECAYECGLNGDDEEEWYKIASEGGVEAAKWLLEARVRHEYENVYTECIDTPFSLLNKLMESLKDE